MSLNRDAKVFWENCRTHCSRFFDACRALIKRKVRRGNNDESKWSTEGGKTRNRWQCVECALFVSLSPDDTFYIYHVSLCVLSPSPDHPQRLLMRPSLSFFHLTSTTSAAGELDHAFTERARELTFASRMQNTDFQCSSRTLTSSLSYYKMMAEFFSKFSFL